MAKKTTLNEIGEMLERVVKHMLTKEDGEKFATKDQVLALQTQLNSISCVTRRPKSASATSSTKSSALPAASPTSAEGTAPP